MAGVGFIAIAAFVVYSLVAPIPPLHGRRDSLLKRLKWVAQDVNQYRSEHGSLPHSLDEVSVPKDPYGDGYQLSIAGDGSFLVVANHAFSDTNGSQFQYTCNEKLEIKKVPQ